MLVTCTGCPARGQHCSGCLITAMSAMPAPTRSAPWEDEDFRVLDLLCETGLVSDGGAARARLDYEFSARLRAVG